MARPRSDAWLWVLNAVVIGTVVLAAAAAATTTGHTIVAASNHFLLYYVGVLALIALTAEVGIGLVASDRILMKPSARVTAQALHRAMGFGAIAFLVIHIVLEIIAGRSGPADAVIPFLDKGKTFYLGLGTVASDMFIVIMMTGIFRARLAANMSPKAWRVIHASAYAAWIFGLVHGLLGGRPAKAFFGFSGFVAWSYGACVVAVAAALMVRLVAKNRAGNELASHPVSDSGGTGGWTAAAAALSGAGAIPGAAALTATAMPAPALAAGSPGALDGGRARSRQPGRAQLALPAGASSAQQPGRQMRSAPYDERAAYLADTRRIGATGPIGPGATGSFERTSQFGGAAQDPRERTGPVRAHRAPAAGRPVRADRARCRRSATTRAPASTSTSGPGRSTARASTSSRGQIRCAATRCAAARFPVARFQAASDWRPRRLRAAPFQARAARTGSAGTGSARAASARAGAPGPCSLGQRSTASPASP